MQHVAGKNAGQVVLYALSTCGWCRKTRQLLEEMGIEYYYDYVDQLQGNDRQQALESVQRWNPERSFPTMVINNEKSIIGYKENEIRKVLVQ